MQRTLPYGGSLFQGLFVTAVKDGGQGRDPLSEDAAIRAARQHGLDIGPNQAYF
jgi:hypothetical protein